MAKFLSQATYTTEGLKGLLKEGGSARRKALDKMAASLGGKVESLYFAFGKTDAFIVFDVPDNATAAAVSMIANATGTAKTELTVLLTPEEIDAAVKKSADYRPPGR